MGALLDIATGHTAGLQLTLVEEGRYGCNHNALHAIAPHNQGRLDWLGNKELRDRNPGRPPLLEQPIIFSFQSNHLKPGILSLHRKSGIYPLESFFKSGD